MRQISISTDVFSMIWSARRSGEENEDDILRRILANLPEIRISRDPLKAGFVDRRHKVEFPESFEIFRQYKGRQYSAKARQGLWVTPSGATYPSLNALSQAIVGGAENAWINWNYLDSNGKSRRIAELRKSDAVARRGEQHQALTSKEDLTMATWRDDVVTALKQIGGKGSLDQIYRAVRSIRQRSGNTLPTNTNAIVRRELEYNSSDSESFTGRFDLFFSVNGIGSGIWGLR